MMQTMAEGPSGGNVEAADAAMSGKQAWPAYDDPAWLSILAGASTIG